MSNIRVYQPSLSLLIFRGVTAKKVEELKYLVEDWWITWRLINTQASVHHLNANTPCTLPTTSPTPTLLWNIIEHNPLVLPHFTESDSCIRVATTVISDSAHPLHLHFALPVWLQAQNDADTNNSKYLDAWILFLLATKHISVHTFVL